MRISWWGPTSDHRADDAHQWVEVGVLPGQYVLIRRGGDDPSMWVVQSWPNWEGFVAAVRAGHMDLVGDPDAPVKIHGSHKDPGDGFEVQLIDWMHFIDALRDAEGGFAPVVSAEA